MKPRPLGAELIRADGRTDRQTDMTKLTVALFAIWILQKSLKICHTNITASHVQFIRLETKICAAQIVGQSPILIGTAQQPKSCNLTICRHWHKQCKTMNITFTKGLKAQRTRKLKDTLISFYYSCIHGLTCVIFTDHPALTDRKTSSLSINARSVKNDRHKSSNKVDLIAMFLMRTTAKCTYIESYIWNSSLSTIISKEWYFAIFHPVKKVKKSVFDYIPAFKVQWSKEIRT
jgi:hypothetical protein